jgi:predicted dehydrogenase
MGTELTDLVFGSGYAAEGHVIALQHADVEVIGIAGRTEDACRSRAESLTISVWGTAWRRMLWDLEPDIVAISTPGRTHRELAMAALEAGCRVYREKPLATTAADARGLSILARETGRKTAYAARTRYHPQVVYAQELVRDGVLGRVSELEFVSHIHLPRLMPFG